MSELSTSSRIVERFRWEGFGFPLILAQARFITTPSGYEILDIDMNALKRTVLKALILKPWSLTGAELRFIRTALELKQADFAALIDVAGHSSVAQWEAKKDAPSGMGLHTELILRLKVAAQIEQGLDRQVLDDIVKPGMAKLQGDHPPLELLAPLPHAA